MKKIIVLLLAIVMTVSLTACGESSEAAEEAKAEEPAVEEAETENPAVEEAETENPDVTDEGDAAVSELTNQYGDPTNHQPVADDGLSWTFDENSGTLTLSGSGPMKDYGESDEAPWDIYAEEIQAIVIEDGITSVGNNAFDYYWELTSVSIPDTVEYIGEDAFAYSAGWEIRLPSALKEIGAYAFYTNDDHTPLVIPEGTEIVGRGAFMVNEFVDTVSIPASVWFVGERAFSNDFHVHDFIVDPGNSNYTSSEGVLYNKDMTVLMNYPSLKEETEFVIPDTVERISDMAFIVNYFLQKITIPQSVKEVGTTDLFMSYMALEEISVENGSGLFETDGGALLSKDGTVLYRYPMMNKAEEYSIPEGVEVIGQCH